MIRVNKILCPVDFFPSSERAADYAMALARNYEARLTLLHVVSPMISPAYEVTMNLKDIVNSMRTSAEAELKRVTQRVRSKGVAAIPVIRTGGIDIEIENFVSKEKPDLVVMGTHGRKSLERWFMGSHTERLLRRLPIPILVIGPGKSKGMSPSIRRILVTTDFSDGTPEAMAYAFSIAQEWQAKVTLLHVIGKLATNLSPGYKISLSRNIGDDLEKLVPDEARDCCEVATRVESGIPVTEILKVLKRDRIDLVVMNIHGKGMLDRALLGSTAERVVRGAGVPVLLIPPRASSKRKKRQARKAA